jgi:uncharacterized membrane protein YsdA (DUF1294 family)
MLMRRRRMRPELFHGGVALSAGLLASGLLLLLFRAPLTWATCLGAWLVSMNVIAFLYYGFDKARARSASSRVPEVVLHGLTFAGGSAGSYAGMRFYRHKTIKGSFRIMFWFIVVLQAGLAAAVIYRLVRP